MPVGGKALKLYTQAESDFFLPPAEHFLASIEIDG